MVSMSESTIIGQSPKVVELRNQIERVSSTDLSVLLSGETGVGKEVFAREIHRRRTVEQGRTGAFVVIDCTNLPSAFAESMLLGHAHEISDGAEPGRTSPFETATHGTVFIDEIGDLPLPLQSKLLRVLQDRKIMAVGSTVARDIDIRVIASTQRDLEAMRDARLFREDLYYRLCECVLVVPPLRDRGEDIGLLADAFLDEFGDALSFADDARIALAEHAWPGNVRELRSVIRRAAVLRREPGSLSGADLFDGPRRRVLDDPQWLRFLDRSWDEAKDEFARWYWTGVWQRYQGDKHKIADHADVSQVWLRSRRKLYELTGR
jgi:transcriptional regulator with PAS, ATPase and Fis domain